VKQTDMTGRQDIKEYRRNKRRGQAGKTVGILPGQRRNIGGTERRTSMQGRVE
jgi:hypothetical protein